MLREAKSTGGTEMTPHRALSAEGQCNLQDELEAMKLEVLALREALLSVDDNFSFDCEEQFYSLELVGKALTNSEESAKLVRAGIEADVMEEVLSSSQLDDHGAFVVWIGNIEAMVEERRVIAKGEK
jgi:hypothetical protein